MGKAEYVALLKPLTTIVKVMVVTVIALVWADQAGYTMSTILAGLGVGSLAVALAAQKTLENVIGAITLYTARPVKPGDLCRFGKVIGVVEEIGAEQGAVDRGDEKGPLVGLVAEVEADFFRAPSVDGAAVGGREGAASRLTSNPKSAIKLPLNAF